MKLSAFPSSSRISSTCRQSGYQTRGFHFPPNGTPLTLCVYSILGWAPPRPSPQFSHPGVPCRAPWHPLGLHRWLENLLASTSHCLCPALMPSQSCPPNPWLWSWALATDHPPQSLPAQSHPTHSCSPPLSCPQILEPVTVPQESDSWVVCGAEMLRASQESKCPIPFSS